jgi:hypothetical protein
VIESRKRTRDGVGQAEAERGRFVVSLELLKWQHQQAGVGTSVAGTGVGTAVRCVLLTGAMKR